MGASGTLSPGRARDSRVISHSPPPGRGTFTHNNKRGDGFGESFPRKPMGYASLRACLVDLERTKQLVRLEEEVDPYLEAAAIQRRVYQAQGPALLFARVKGCRFPMVSNLFGTIERTRFLFRDMLQAVRQLVELKVDPGNFWKHPWRYRNVPRALWFMRPKFVRTGPVLDCETTISQLPK